MKTSEIYERLIEEGYFQEETLEVLTCINGFNTETLNDAIYAKYGIRDYQDLFNLED